MKIKELLTDETRWTQFCEAQNARGNVVEPHASDAVCFCLIGAVIRCYRDPNERRDVLLKIRRKLTGDESTPEILPLSIITQWNDRPTRTFNDVATLVNELDI